MILVGANMNTEIFSEKMLKLEMENQKLRRALEELSILNEIATAINSALSLDRILDLVVQKCLKHLRVEQGVVLLLDEEYDYAPGRRNQAVDDRHAGTEFPTAIDQRVDR